MKKKNAAPACHKSALSTDTTVLDGGDALLLSEFNDHEAGDNIASFLVILNEFSRSTVYSATTPQDIQVG